MREIRYVHAINEAMHEEMARDSDVILMGEDVGPSGGAFGASRGLTEKFGEAHSGNAHLRGEFYRYGGRELLPVACAQLSKLCFLIF